MFCIKYGKQLEQNLNFCTNCGNPINNQQNNLNLEKKKKSNKNKDTNYIVEAMIQGTSVYAYKEALNSINEIVLSVEKANSFVAGDANEYKDALGYKGKLEFKK